MTLESDLEEYCSIAKQEVFNPGEMASFEDAETEETLTCLRIQVYHPHQSAKDVFRHLQFHRKLRHRAEDTVLFGRDAKACDVSFYDTRVSRSQFALQAFRAFERSELCFEIKHVSKRGSMAVNGLPLQHLHKVELPEKALVRFSDFQLLILKEPGESRDSFEIVFEPCAAPPCQEVGEVVPCGSPVVDSGFHSQECAVSASVSLRGPLENDERMLIK
ncbi:TRAF-interacting protein with FHA domain-containing protein A-like [Lepisosteus oculatus]|uniref:TRAF-interacting protein with FHA domain-containing protein A-like n=1 Tax=Lepisosteus oculatus TaxID=7918 RepID=UPI003718966D